MHRPGDFYEIKTLRLARRTRLAQKLFSGIAKTFAVCSYNIANFGTLYICNGELRRYMKVVSVCGSCDCTNCRAYRVTMIRINLFARIFLRLCADAGLSFDLFFWMREWPLIHREMTISYDYVCGARRKSKVFRVAGAQGLHKRHTKRPSVVHTCQKYRAWSFTYEIIRTRMLSLCLLISTSENKDTRDSLMTL